MPLRIGVDVGGTNTDAAVLDGVTVLASCKRSTSRDVLSGVVEALREVTRDIETAQVHSVVIGTTHFINAITQARLLAPVVAVRLASTPVPLPPFTDWPARIADAVRGAIVEVEGGHQFDGTPLGEADLDRLRTLIAGHTGAGLRDVVVTSVFSPVTPDGERAAQAVIEQVCPQALVTLSHEVGRIGLLERENAALLNGALRPLARHVVDGFVQATADVGIDAPLFLSQNDGTVMSVETALRFPILTVASGPTNSMRGAAVQSGLSDCVVVDVGGTTTDIGLLRDGFPRESSLAVQLGGVRTNFRMPDVVSLGIGGGSLVVATGAGVVVGPDSVGYELTSRARVFGGDETTLTDVAVAAGRLVVGDPTLVADLDPDLVAGALRYVDDVVSECIDRVKLDGADLPVVVVGGGAPLLASELPGASVVIHPAHSGAANAIGAALANISGEVDRIFSLVGTTRADAMAAARAEAVADAVAAGATPESVRVVDEEDIPLAHLPGGTALRIRVRVLGDLDLSDHTSGESPTGESATGESAPGESATGQSEPGESNGAKEAADA